jgi:hypothetical protein
VQKLLIARKLLEYPVQKSAEEYESKGLSEAELTVDSLKLRGEGKEQNAETLRARGKEEWFVGKVEGEENMGKSSTGLARR